MSVHIHFCYDTQNKGHLAADEVSCQGLQPLFEIYPEELEPNEFEAIKDAGLYPDFVADFPKTFVYVDEDEPEPDEDEMIERLMNGEGIDAYIGPSFDPAELLAWTTLWIENISSMDETDKKDMHFMSDNGFDWTPGILRDLQQIKAQAECAQRHGITMHLEMY